mmetsp:Transcript_13177/g.25459  ORF Transcript_13177/g.25459 Transcript_13177/m.25459 type:complete len:163 (-) Transcript_13177:47-535(-)
MASSPELRRSRRRRWLLLLIGAIGMVAGIVPPQVFIMAPRPHASPCNLAIEADFASVSNKASTASVTGPIAAAGATWAALPQHARAEEAAAGGGYQLGSFGVALILFLPLLLWVANVASEWKKADETRKSKPPGWSMGADKDVQEMKVPRRLRRQAEKEGWG